MLKENMYHILFCDMSSKIINLYSIKEKTSKNKIKEQSASIFIENRTKF